MFDSKHSSFALAISAVKAFSAKGKWTIVGDLSERLMTEVRPLSRDAVDAEVPVGLYARAAVIDRTNQSGQPVYPVAKFRPCD
jgi:hypothetical protein